MNVLRVLCRPVVLLTALLGPVACGVTLEVGIERTDTPDPLATTPGAIQETAEPFSGPTPTPYMDHWVAYSNPYLGISLQYPVNWQPLPEYSNLETGEAGFAGDNGFFRVSSMSAPGLDDAATSEGLHVQRPYGSRPIIKNLQVHGQEARLIIPSADQDPLMEQQAALIALYPRPVDIYGISHQYLVLRADATHIRVIAQTLKFNANLLSVQVPTLSPPSVWERLPPGLVYSTCDGLVLINADEQALQIHNNPQAVISADGAQLISYDSLERDAWLINRVAGSVWKLTHTPERTELYFSWWPGRPDVVLFQSSASDVSLGAEMQYYLTAVNTDGQVYQVLDAERDTGTASGPGQFSPSPNGQTIAYSSQGVGWLYHWGIGSEVFAPADYGLSVRDGVEMAQPAWSPDGTRLAWIVKGNLAADGGLQTGVAVFDLQARSARVIHPHESQGVGWPSPPAWSPDGQWLAFGDGSPSDRAGLWVAQTGESGAEYHLGLGGNPIWSPDGKWLAFQGILQDGAPAYMLAEVGTWGLRQLDVAPDRYGMLVDWIDL